MLETKHAVHPGDAATYNTERLRREFFTGSLMQPGAIRLIYTHYDRFIYGGIMPLDSELILPTYPELRADFFLQRREMGILNVGGAGEVSVDGERFELANLDLLYIGKGKKDIRFSSRNPEQAACFYLNSCPAHAEYPTLRQSKAEANQVALGSQEFCNERVIYQFIHENGIQSCQLVMGFTELKPGNIWNTFPPHTHERRMEVYFYFDLPENQIVVHFMGQPQETRHLAMHNFDAVVSPPWSIHAGAGTCAYKFVWGMAGENKAFTDMDPVLLSDFR